MKIAYFLSGSTVLLRSIKANNSTATMKIICSFNRLSFFIIFMIAKVPIGKRTVKLMIVGARPNWITVSIKPVIFYSPLNFDKICG
jgi:hypothetical protein